VNRSKTSNEKTVTSRVMIEVFQGGWSSAIWPCSKKELRELKILHCRKRGCMLYFGALQAPLMVK